MTWGKQQGFRFASQITFGILAQLGEHLPYKQRVIGSSPIGPIQLAFLMDCLGSTNDWNGGIAQLARAHGSYPWCREFKSPFRYFFMPIFRAFADFAISNVIKSVIRTNVRREKLHIGLKINRPQIGLFFCTRFSHKRAFYIIVW